MNLFAYGSLMFPEVWHRITGLTGPRLPLRIFRLCGYEARCLRGQSYPVLLPVAGGVARGVVYPDLNPAHLALLDEFEGDFYERVEVTVQEAAGAPVPAWVYRAARPDHPDILPECWDAVDFARNHLEKFLAGDPGFS